MNIVCTRISDRDLRFSDRIHAVSVGAAWYVLVHVW